MSKPGAPRVSVILPVYNGQQFIRRAIENALSQSLDNLDNLEILVIDDGSTDGTPEILQGFGERIRAFRQINQGCYVARNLGLRHARGELIAFLDADDAWLPGKLAAQISLMDARPNVGLVLGNAIFEDELGRRGRTAFDYVPPARGKVFRTLVEGNFIPTSSVLVRRRCLDEVGPFKEVRLAADYHKWLQIAMRYEVDYVEEPVSIYTVHSSNISSNRESPKPPALMTNFGSKVEPLTTPIPRKPLAP